jgi:tetratricopeptide (TPR) repeat protein
VKINTHRIGGGFLAVVALVAGVHTLFWDQARRSASVEHLPAELETALLSSNWERIRQVASFCLTNAAARRQASVLCGYAALIRGEPAVGTKHFLRARSGQTAKRDFRWAEELALRFPTNAIAQLLAADGSLRTRDGTKAAARLDLALRLAPELDAARLARAALHALQGESDLALVDIAPLVTNTAVASDALAMRGLVRLSQGEPQGAVADFNEAFDLAPDHPVVLNARGVAHAQLGDWRAAAEDFETAFRLAPDLVEARDNWQIARDAASERGVEVASAWQLGVFGTGIRNEAVWDYAQTHARDLIQGRPQSFIYVAIKGNLPLAGIEKMQRQGVETVVVDPKSPEAGHARIESFIKESVSSGRNPIVFVDVNKWVPKQLGNDKFTAQDFPAEIAVRANSAFRQEVAQLGGRAQSTMAGHSDFTWVVNQASILASKVGTPFDRAVLESPRSEDGVKEAVRLAPKTQFTVVQPIQGDFFTLEAQQRAMKFESGAYRKTIDAFKSIDAPNYRLALVENPTPNGFLGMPQAHGDPAAYNRFTEVSLWAGGREVGAAKGPLGKTLTQFQSVENARFSPMQPQGRGGVRISSINLRQASGGRVIFGSGNHREADLRLVYPIFGSGLSGGDAPQKGTAFVLSK